MRKAVTPRDNCNSCTPKERARIEKYAAKNGSVKIARYIAKLLDQKMIVKLHMQPRRQNDYIRCELANIKI